MATTMYFGEVLHDKEGSAAPIELEFGRSSYYRDNLLYITVDGKTVILSDQDGRRLCEAMASCASYLGY